MHFLSRLKIKAKPNRKREFRGFLTRLARNTAGNTLVIMAAAIIPLAGLAGGAVDMSRIYLTKTRMQQACDAGALAGRKVMGSGAWSANSGAANTAALQFFDSNFKTGAYGTTGLSRSFTESNGTVTGTATVQVPMTIMRIFMQWNKTVSVTCQSAMQLPNTDVMFVLDNTGSMASKAQSTDTDTKIVTLRFAVKCFYETLMQTDTDANCGSTPSGGVSSSIQIRFGFVPYSTNVNLTDVLNASTNPLPRSYFSTSGWTYQSRVANYTTAFYPTTGTSNTQSYEYYKSGSNTTTTLSQASSISSSDCSSFIQNQSFTGFTRTPSSSLSGGGPPPTSDWTITFSGNTGQDWGFSGAPDTGGSSRSCRRLKTTTTTTYSSTQKYKFTSYDYKPVTTLNATQLIAGNAQTIAIDSGGGNGPGGYVDSSGPYDMIQLPQVSGATGISTTTASWDGCVEERSTNHYSSYYPIPSDTKDLDIDSVPTSGDVTTQWHPTMPDLVFYRGRTSTGSSSRTYSPITNTTADYVTARDYANSGQNYFCPASAEKMQVWSNVTAFDNYVDSLTPTGNTYHDIGLLWGARLISPTGIFTSENATTPSGGSIQRHIIFMTDGDACTDEENYQAYGVAYWDRRETASGATPTGGCNSTGPGNTTDEVNNRFAALCSAVKNKNITLWVIFFGTAGGNDATRMTNCATSGHFYQATSQAALVSAFNDIANKISNLRITT